MDYDQALLDEFAVESKEHLESIEDDFLTLEGQKDNPNRELVDKVFRAIHSIKGTAGFFGLTKIADLSHVMETLLSMVRENEIRPESPFTDAMLAGVDRLNAMLDDLEHSNDMDIESVHAQLERLLAKEVSSDTKDKLDTEVALADSRGADTGFEVDAFTLSHLAKSNFLFVLKFDLTKAGPEGKTSPVALIRDLTKTGTVVDGRVETSTDDLRKGLPDGTILYHVLYDTCLDLEMVSMATGLPEKVIVEVRKEDKLEDAETKEAGESGAEAQPVSPESRAESGQEVEERREDRLKSANGNNGSIRVNVDILDQLMLMAGELVLVRNQQLLVAENSDAFSRGIVQRLDIVTSELQETIMRTRMQPVGNIFNKFPRIVRDLAHKLSKQIDITITGGEVELDKNILENLADPLTHLIRNCCDHGIESGQRRTESDKPPTGTIELSAFHEAGQIIIRVTDDGAGISPKAIKAKILEKGLKTETELAGMSEQEIVSLILLPGFSMAEQISDVSGRGVGMDVVKTSIEKLGGSIELDSSPGRGTTVLLRLPLTLAIIPCLIIKRGEFRYAIPQVNLDELVCLYDEDVLTKIEYADNREVYRLRDRLLSMIRLQEVLETPEPFTEEHRAEIAETHRRERQDSHQAYLQAKAGGEEADLKQTLNFAVVKIGSTRFGLIIDEVIGTEEIVVKPMHPALKSLGCYSGATVMGDGQVALILDIEGIARHTGVVIEQQCEETNEVISGSEVQSILLFKSGEKEQFALSLPLIRRIERIKMSSVEHVGDNEFITIDGASTRIVRLDQHLNVSPCTEQEEMFLLLPKHSPQPVGVLISSLLDIANTFSEMNVESYQEDGLLGTDVLNGQMTLFLDVLRVVELAAPDWFSTRDKNSPPPGDQLKILLVEDASIFRQLVKGYLQKDGYDVTTATDGQAGLDLFQERDFDLIVSDIEMPVMDGLEFIKNVRSGTRNNQIPAVALTALDSREDQERAKDCGFDAYEIKLDREVLLATVAGTLQDRRTAAC